MHIGEMEKKGQPAQSMGGKCMEISLSNDFYFTPITKAQEKHSPQLQRQKPVCFSL